MNELQSYKKLTRDPRKFGLILMAFDVLECAEEINVRALEGTIKCIYDAMEIKRKLDEPGDQVDTINDGFEDHQCEVPQESVFGKNSLKVIEGGKLE